MLVYEFSVGVFTQYNKHSYTYPPWLYIDEEDSHILSDSSLSAILNAFGIIVRHINYITADINFIKASTFSIRNKLPDIQCDKDMLYVSGSLCARVNARIRSIRLGYYFRLDNYYVLRFILHTVFDVYIPVIILIDVVTKEFRGSYSSNLDAVCVETKDVANMLLVCRDLRQLF